MSFKHGVLGTFRGSKRTQNRIKDITKITKANEANVIIEEVTYDTTEPKLISVSEIKEESLVIEEFKEQNIITDIEEKPIIEEPIEEVVERKLSKRERKLLRFAEKI